VHVSALQDAGLSGLNEGDEVSFEVERDRRSGRDAAVNLRVTGSAPGGGARGGARPPRRDFGGGGDSYGRGAPAPRQARPSGQPAGSGSGTVKWFNQTKGFGFIQPSDGGPDVFVHISAVERAGLSSLNEGQPVDYELEADRRTGKTSATNLRVGG